MPDVTDLQTLCSDVLAASVEALDTIPGFAPGLEGAPERTYITDGQPALVCVPCGDQLTVNAATIRPKDTIFDSFTTHKDDFRINLVGVQVWIARCRAMDSPPIPANVEAVAAQTNADAWALWNHLWNLWRSGDLGSLCDRVAFDSLIPLQPSGGCSGWQLNLRVQLDGYDEGT